MKKLLFTAALSLLAMGVFAQKKVLKSAEKAFKKGAYEEAATLAKQAATNDETKGNASVYIVLGKVSLQQYIAGDFNDITLAKESLTQFDKAIELGDEKTKLQVMENPIFNPLDPTKQIDGGTTRGLLEHHLTIESNKALEEENFERAYPMLDLLYQMDPSITERVFFAGYAAENLEMDDVALKHYKIVMDYEGEYGNKEYARKKAIEILLGKEAFEEVLPILRRGKELYPEDRSYGDMEVQVLVESEKMDEAIAGLESIISAGNAAKETYFTLAFLQLNNEEYAKAEASAKKALEMDSEYQDVLYVLGASMYQQGADIMTEANSEIDDDSKYEALKEKGLQRFKDAMPIFEKMLVADPDDLYALRPLSTIYDQLKMAEKRDALLDKIDALEGGGE